MNDTPRPRRSPTVVLLDALLTVVTAVQTGNFPTRRRATTDPTPARRTVPLWLLAGILGTAGGVVILIGALLGTPGGLTNLPLPGRAAPAPAAPTSLAPPITTQQPTPSARPTSASPKPSTSASASASVSASTSASAATPSRSAPPTEATPTLAADYAARNGSGLLGYRATITLTAKGAASTDWRLSITLPRSTLQIGSVTGAEADKEGAIWTLTPVDETRAVKPGTPVTITFDVRGATLVDSQPTDCRINDEPCAGLPTT